MATSVECCIETLFLVIVGMAADGRCTHLSGAARWISISAVPLDIAACSPIGHRFLRLRGPKTERLMELVALVALAVARSAPSRRSIADALIPVAFSLRPLRSFGSFLRGVRPFGFL